MTRTLLGPNHVSVSVLVWKHKPGRRPEGNESQRIPQIIRPRRGVRAGLKRLRASGHVAGKHGFERGQ